MKVCFACKRERPLELFSRFYDKSVRRYRYRSYCRDCHGIRERMRSLAGKKPRTTSKPENKRWRPTPQQRRAHKLLNAAVADGSVLRGACEVCRLPDAEAHHDDYDKPLDVRWLCPKHHRQVHWKKYDTPLEALR